MALQDPLATTSSLFRQIECGDIRNYISPRHWRHLALPPFIARRHRRSLPCDP